MRNLALILVMLAGLAARAASLNGVLYDSTTRSVVPGALSFTNQQKFDSLIVTNQLSFARKTYNGSNGVTALKYTNQLDLSLNVFNCVTNPLGTNVYFSVTNFPASGSNMAGFLLVLKGIGGYSNTVEFGVASGGTNITWLNIQTNGNYDLLVLPGKTYFVQGWAVSQSNLLITVLSDDVVLTSVTASNAAYSVMVGNNVSNALYQSTNVVSTWAVTNATTGAYTNTFDLSPTPGRVSRLGLTNATIYMTNYSGRIANTLANIAIYIHVGGGTVNKTVTWLSGNVHGLHWQTPPVNTLWTTLTNDKVYLYSATLADTNVVQTLVLVE